MLRVVGQHGRHLELRRAGQHEVVPLRVGVEVARQLVAGERHLVGVERAHGLSGCARGAGQAACRVVRVGEVVGRARLRRRGQRFELAFGGMPVGGDRLAGFQLVQRRVLRERVVGVRDVHEGVHGRFGYDAARPRAVFVERAYVQREVAGGVGGRVVAQHRAQFLGAHLLARGQPVGERGHVVARAHLVHEAQRVGVKCILVKFHLRPSVGALGHERLACGDAVGRDAEQHALAAIVKARLHHDHEVVQGHVGAGVLVFEVSDVEVGLAYGRRSGRAGGLDALPRGGVHALGRLPLPGFHGGHLRVFGEAVGVAFARHQLVVGIHVVGGEVREVVLAGPRHLTLGPRVVHKVVRRPPVDAVAQLQKAQHEREPFGRLEIPRVGQRGRHRAGGLRAVDQPPVEQDALHTLHVHERAQVILHVEAVGGVVGRRGVLVDGGVVLDAEDGVHRAVERAGERAGVEGGKRPVHCGERVIVLNAHKAVLRIGEGDVQLAQAAQPRAVEPKGDARRALRGGFGVARAGLLDVLAQVHGGPARSVLHRHRLLHGGRLQHVVADSRRAKAHGVEVQALAGGLVGDVCARGLVLHGEQLGQRGVGSESHHMVVAGKRAQKAVGLGALAGERGRVRDVRVRRSGGGGAHEHEVGHARDARGGLRGGFFQQPARRVQRQLRVGIAGEAAVGGLDAGRFGRGGDGEAVAAAGQPADELHVAALGVGRVGVERQHHRGVQVVADHGHAVLAVSRLLFHEVADGAVQRVGKMLGVRFAVVGERIERGAEGDDEHDVVRVHLLGAHGGGR